MTKVDLTEINFLLEKYLALFHKFRHLPNMTQTDDLISYWKSEILPHIVDADTTYSIIDKMYRFDLNKCLGKDEITIALRNDMRAIAPDKEKKNWWFMTLGFDDKIITIPELIACHNKVIKTKGIMVESFVIENFRKDDNGKIYEHKHIHYLVKTDLKKGEVIDRVFKKCYKFMCGRNFVDMKNEQPYDNYINYIKGIKTQDKLECVEKDKVWRSENNIPTQL